MQRYLLGSLALVGAIMAAAACGAHTTDATVSPGGEDAGPVPEGDDGGGVDDGLNLTGIGAGTGANTGLPCDVQQVLENRCIGCHIGPTPVALLSYANLTAPAPSDPSKTLAAKCVERLKSTTNPMPPPPAVPPTLAELTVFDNWVNAGTPMGTTCTDGADAGAPPGVDAGTTNYNTLPVCTSNKVWNKGNHGSPDMQPGGACLTCHSMRGGPSYAIAGTVYPTAHEPTECNGVNIANLKVVVTDKNGIVTTVPVNAVGNYFSTAAIAAPFHVKVTDGTRTRSMAGALTAGDCNSCHTEAGANGAPGRIMAP
ncbi:MAG: hypothetical protein ABIP39_16400 [Polyangiaceae bacterium]